MANQRRGRPNGSVRTVAKSAIGRLIQTGRIKNGLSLKDLSKELGVRLQFVSNIEQGRAPFPLRYAGKLAVILGEPRLSVVGAALLSSRNYLGLVEELRSLDLQLKLGFSA